jgi:methionine-rich copper-binding protein CopC
MTTVMRTAAALLGALLAVIALTTAPTAWAHATRIATDPAVNAVLTTGPSQVSATFNEHLHTTFAAMTGGFADTADIDQTRLLARQLIEPVLHAIQQRGDCHV